MNFKLTSDSDRVSGTSLKAYVEEQKRYETESGKSMDSLLVALFGVPKDGYVDEEKGYDGYEWVFESEDEYTVTLYSRWGSYRVGAHDSGVALDFLAWLDEQLNPESK